MHIVRTTPALRITAFFGPTTNPYTKKEDDMEGTLLRRGRERMNQRDSKLQYEDEEDAEDDLFPEEKGVRVPGELPQQMKTTVDDYYARA